MSTSFSSDGIVAINFYLYTPVLLFALWQIVARHRLELRYSEQIRKVDMPVGRTMLWFSRFVALGLGTRLVWFVLRDDSVLGHDKCRVHWTCEYLVVVAVNRCATWAFFVGFSLIVGFWNRTTKGRAARLYKMMLALGIWVFIAQVIAVTVSLLLPEDASSSLIRKLDNAYTYQIVGMFILLGITFPYAGFQFRKYLLHTLKMHRIVVARRRKRPDLESGRFFSVAQIPLPVDGESSPLRPSARAKKMRAEIDSDDEDDFAYTDDTDNLLRRSVRTVVVTVALVAPLFIFRAIMFLYEPLVKKQLDGEAANWLYPWFFYTVPELVASCILLYVAHPDFAGACLCLPCCPSAPKAKERADHGWTEPEESPDIRFRRLDQDVLGSPLLARDVGIKITGRIVLPESSHGEYEAPELRPASVGSVSSIMSDASISL